MRLCKMVRFCANFCTRFCVFLCISVRFSCQNGQQKSGKFAYNRANMCHKTFLSNTPFSYTPFCVSPINLIVHSLARSKGRGLASLKGSSVLDPLKMDVLLTGIFACKVWIS